MRKLYLIRHAKSSWKNNGLSDIERPLNKRGKKDAPFMGRLLNNSGIKPGMMVSSPALRAFKTAKAIAEEINFPVEKIIKNNLIYEADVNELLDIVKNFPDEFKIIMMFGHNPGFTLLNNFITDKFIDNVVTCGVVEIEFSISSWKEVGENSGKVISYKIHFCMKNKILFNRELSWLSFNYRVLQEAKDKTVPLYERIKFMAIYSSNLDEFFRVRVASLRSLLNLKKKSRKELSFNIKKLLKDIHETVADQQEELGNIYRNQILFQLRKNNIYLANPLKINARQKSYLKEYFEENILKHIKPLILNKKNPPFIKNRLIYLAAKLSLTDKADGRSKTGKTKYALIELPVPPFSRFIELPAENDKHCIIFLDDVIRLNLDTVFNTYKVIEAYSVKLTRDAEIYINDEFTGNLLSKIKKGLKNRDAGPPCRFLYDHSMPDEFLSFLKEGLSLEDEDLIPGGRYHNFNDFFTFPNPGAKEFEYNRLPPLKHKELESYDNIFEAVSRKDYSLHFPYHRYNYIENFIGTAANDKQVTSIKISLYRVAGNSSIVKSLIQAARSGKEVIAFVEVKARFDEEANIQWAEEMEKAGVKVFYSFPGLKVHSKIALVKRKEDNRVERYAYLATGNFNEKTAKIYSDYGYLTSDKRLTFEVEKVFDYLARKDIDFKFEHLLVAQFNMRKKLIKLIKNEIESAKQGKEAKIILKMNSLEDKKMIKMLYLAGMAGVKIDIIARGICCLIPGVKGLSENINVISIVDRFLEHSRFYYFHNDGDEIIYASSADWMKRNLSRRIETAFPVYDKDLKKEIKDILEIQLSDNTKARIIDKSQSNRYKKNRNPRKINAQIAIYDYLKTKPAAPDNQNINEVLK